MVGLWRKFSPLDSSLAKWRTRHSSRYRIKREIEEGQGDFEGKISRKFGFALLNLTHLIHQLPRGLNDPHERALVTEGQRRKRRSTLQLRTTSIGAMEIRTLMHMAGSSEIGIVRSVYSGITGTCESERRGKTMINKVRTRNFQF